ncbi:MAG: EamA family transporter [Euryarchaeota archaeon]|nr:EamA family transporter [Euryarchaeota archaeon]
MASIVPPMALPLEAAALGAALLFSLSGLVDKVALTHRMGSGPAYFFYTNLVFLLLYLPLNLLHRPLSLPPVEQAAPVALISGLTFASVWVYYRALQKGDLSTIIPLSSTRPLFAVPAAALLVGEWHGAQAPLGILLIALGALLTNAREGVPLRRLLAPRDPVFWLIMLGNLLIVLANTLTKPLLAHVDGYDFVLWRYGIWVLLGAALAPLWLRGPHRDALARGWRPTLPLAVLSGLIIYGMLALLFHALARSVQITEGLLTTQGLWAILLAALASRLRPGSVAEEHTPRVYGTRALGALLILAGVAGLLLLR